MNGTVTCAHLHSEITSKNEKIRNRISRGRFLVISVSSDSKKEFCEWNEIEKHVIRGMERIDKMNK